MARRVSNIEDLSGTIALDMMLAYADSPVGAIRGRPDAFTIRNAVLGNLAVGVGQTKRTLGLLWMARRDSPEHDHGGLERLADRRRAQVGEAAVLACATCPLQAECGLGPSELVEKLHDKQARRRFKGRMQNHKKTNTHYCSTNLNSARLQRDIA